MSRRRRATVVLVIAGSFIALAIAGTVAVGLVAIPLAAVACIFAALPVLAFSGVRDDRPWNRLRGEDQD